MLVGNLPLGTPWPRQHERTTTCKTIDVMEWLAVAAHSNNNRWRVKMIEETRRAHRHWTAPTQFSIEGRERGIHTISKNIHRWGDVSAEATLSLINYVIIDCHASMMCHYPLQHLVLTWWMMMSSDFTSLTFGARSTIPSIIIFHCLSSYAHMHILSHHNNDMLIVHSSHSSSSSRHAPDAISEKCVGLFVGGEYLRQRNL